jgi:hypothetical protein
MGAVEGNGMHDRPLHESPRTANPTSKAPGSPQAIAALQSAAGNRAVAGLIARSNLQRVVPTPPPAQPGASAGDGAGATPVAAPPSQVATEGQAGSTWERWDVEITRPLGGIVDALASGAPAYARLSDTVSRLQFDVNAYANDPRVRDQVAVVGASLGALARGLGTRDGGRRDDATDARNGIEMASVEASQLADIGHDGEAIWEVSGVVRAWDERVASPLAEAARVVAQLRDDDSINWDRVNHLVHAASGSARELAGQLPAGPARQAGLRARRLVTDAWNSMRAAQGIHIGHEELRRQAEAARTDAVRAQSAMSLLEASPSQGGA